MRVRIRQRDVALATEPPASLSSHNLLPARIVSIAASGAHECCVQLDCAGTALLSIVTRDAVDRLGLCAGRPVWAVIKSVTLSGT